MKSRDPSDPLSAALRRLASPPASPGFTRSVLERLDAADSRRRRRRVAVAALAAAAVLAALGLASLPLLGPARAPAGGEVALARAEEIRRQQRLLEEELQRLERARDRARPVLYLDSSGDYDLVLDLSPLLDERIGTPVVPTLEDLRIRRPEAREAARRQP